MKGARSSKHQSTVKLLERLAKHELRTALHDRVKLGRTTPYAVNGSFLWTELTSVVTRSLRLEMEAEQFRAQMPQSVRWLAEKLVALSNHQWASFQATPERREPPARKRVNLPTRRGRSSVDDNAVQRVAALLLDALGDLYGSDRRAAFIEKNGRINWRFVGAEGWPSDRWRWS